MFHLIVTMVITMIFIVSHVLHPSTGIFLYIPAPTPIITAESIIEIIGWSLKQSMSLPHQEWSKIRLVLPLLLIKKARSRLIRGTYSS